ncbi:MAG: GNAT family N-acetyltransferase [Gammaproteobacteria bacterium]|nr:GNAT family N-acetyltransferase [Gammaproteobacteria bacterium]
MSEIKFTVDEKTGRLDVTIDTARLHLESINTTYCDDIVKLCNDPVVMMKNADGLPWSIEDTKHMVVYWAAQWNRNNPLSDFAVSKNDGGKEFIGIVGLVHTPYPGEADVGYLFNKSAWGQRYGTEAVSALVKEYVPEIIKHNYQIGGEPLSVLTADAHTDNVASVKILEGVGLKKVAEKNKYGYPHFFFSMKTADLVKPTISAEKDFQPTRLSA